MLHYYCRYQIFNNKQESNMEGPSLVIDQMWLKNAKLSIFKIFMTILQSIQSMTIVFSTSILNALSIVPSNHREHMCTWSLFCLEERCVWCFRLELDSIMHKCFAHACIRSSWWCMWWILQDWRKHFTWMSQVLCESD